MSLSLTKILLMLIDKNFRIMIYILETIYFNWNLNIFYVNLSIYTNKTPNTMDLQRFLSNSCLDINALYISFMKICNILTYSVTKLNRSIFSNYSKCYFNKSVFIISYRHDAIAVYFYVTYLVDYFLMKWISACSVFVKIKFEFTFDAKK